MSNDHSNLYNVNGLVFWSQEEIRVRNMFVDHIVSKVQNCLITMNQAFKMVQCEAPILTPVEFINKNYSVDDYYSVNLPEKIPLLVLRPETTMGSYAYAKHILSGYSIPKYKLPICVWQHGKSFRREQDQPTKFVRLKEFYQLEFQILYPASTFNDYYPNLLQTTCNALNDLLGNCSITPSDRVPDYSEETNDIVFGEEKMEIASISRRKDYEGAKNVEIAIGTCRAVHNFIRNIDFNIVKNMLR